MHLTHVFLLIGVQKTSRRVHDPSYQRTLTLLGSAQRGWEWRSILLPLLALIQIQKQAQGSNQEILFKYILI